jgi:hypothetical protein
VSARLLPALALVLAALPARGGDGLGAVAATNLALGAGAGSVAALGTRGVGFGAAVGDGFAYGSLSFSAATVELGVARPVFRAGRATLVAGLGGLVSPLHGWTAGGRGVLSLATQLGEAFFLRPGLTASIGAVAGPEHGLTLLAPVELSLELGTTAFEGFPYLRLAAGLDPLSGRLATGRAEAALGFAFGAAR